VEEGWSVANKEHLARLKQGVEAWNQWRDENPDIRPDLTRANLIGATLIGVNLTAATVRRANFTRADLTDATLIGADLTRATLTGATLYETTLTRVILAEADLTEVNVESTKWADVDLRTVHGFETMIHHTRSTLGIDTIYRSSGQVPDVFLRGVGVPEDFIPYIKSLVGRPFEFYSCFISYSSQDQEFAERLHADLQNKGVRCWFAPHDIQGGRKIHEQIDQAIRFHERLLLVLSSHSMNSEWVKTEVAKARQREMHEKRQVLFPVRLVSFEAVRSWECFDGDTGKDSAREIRGYFIPDFSNWKDYDAYQKAFRRLLRDLKANI
jgi:hypothetical protein